MHRLAVTLSVFVLATIAPLYAAPDPLDAVYGHIDAAAKTFKGMTADISDTEYTALVDEKDVKTGTIKLLRAKDGTRLLMNLGNDVLALDPKEGKRYNPKINVMDVFDVGDRQNQINQYLLLGFGASSSSDLKSTYDVTLVGDEKIGGQQTSHLKLIPKSADTKRTLKQADLWFGENGLAVQQKFLQASNDYKLVTYSNMKLVPPSDKDLELKPKGAKIQKH